MYQYEQAKIRLFKRPGLNTIIINIDDPVGLKIANNKLHNISLVTYSIYKMANIYAFNIKNQNFGQTFIICSKEKKSKLRLIF